MIPILFLAALLAPAPAGPALSELRGDYLGQPGPGPRAVPFARDFMGKGVYSSVQFSPDGSEVYWSTQASILWSHRVEGRWTRPEAIALSGMNGTCPVLSPDGKRLYFMHWDGKKGRYAQVERISSGWSETRFLPDVINTVPNLHWNLAVDRKGTLYFTSGRTNLDVQILCAEPRDGGYSQPRVVAELKDAFTICPCVAPDGSYLIFTRTEPREGTHPDKGLYIMFRKAGGWTAPRSLTERIGGRGFSASLSPDGRYLFFMDGGVQYWVETSFLEEMRRQALAG